MALRPTAPVLPMLTRRDFKFKFASAGVSTLPDVVELFPVDRSRWREGKT
jgi:hypothetical protein